MKKLKPSQHKKKRKQPIVPKRKTIKSERPYIPDNPKKDFLKPSSPQKKIGVLKKFKKIITFILLVVAAIPAVYFIYDRYFKSKHQEFEEKNIDSGTIQFTSTRNIADNNDTVQLKNTEINKKFYFNYATYKYPSVKGIYVHNLSKLSQNDFVNFYVYSNYFQFSKRELDSGINIINYQVVKFTDCGTDSISPVWVVDRGDTIYVSTKMIDLITGHEIGEMVFNHWTVYYDELMNYYPGKDRFEVKDKQGYIVFSIADISSNGQIAIGISGYFNSPNSVLIYDNSDRSGGLNCISKSDKDWLKTAKVRASKIKSVFSNH